MHRREKSHRPVVHVPSSRETLGDQKNKDSNSADQPAAPYWLWVEGLSCWTEVGEAHIGGSVLVRF